MMEYKGNYIKHIRQIREMFLKDATLTVDQINDQLESGPYATKYVAMMRKYLNFGITVNKDGRTVVSYTFDKDTDVDLFQWDKAPKVKKVKEKKVKEKKVKAKPAKKVKAKPAPKVVAEIEEDEDDVPVMDRKPSKAELHDEFVEPLAASSYAVDGDWDGDTDTQTVRDLLR